MYIDMHADDEQIFYARYFTQRAMNIGKHFLKFKNNNGTSWKLLQDSW